MEHAEQQKIFYHLSLQDKLSEKYSVGQQM